MDPRICDGRVPVNKIIPFSAVDGPGNRTAVFLQGCGFNCRYCHNPETRAVCINCGLCGSKCPAQALTMEEGLVTFHPEKCVSCDTCIHTCPHDASPRIRFLNPSETLKEILKNTPYIRGVTVSGGECTTYPVYLRVLGELCHQEGLGFLLDSNGSYDFEKDEAKLLPAIDGVMLDVKAFDPSEHERVTGVSNEMVLKNLHVLAEHGKLYEVRTVVAPDLFQAEQTVRAVSRVLKPYLPIARSQTTGEVRNIRYKIIKYRPMGVRSTYRDMTVPQDDFLQHLSDIAKSEGIEDVIII